MEEGGGKTGSSFLILLPSHCRMLAATVAVDSLASELAAATRIGKTFMAQSGGRGAAAVGKTSAAVVEGGGGIKVLIWGS